MKRRIAIWASASFVMASCFVLYTFVTPPEDLVRILREPVGEAIAFASLPIGFAFHKVPLPFWAVPPMNGATYAVIGLVLEVLRRKRKPSLAV